jgi:hypothetical protein
MTGILAAPDDLAKVAGRERLRARLSGLAKVLLMPLLVGSWTPGRAR